MIQAKVIADSINASGDRLTTIEASFGRMILNELAKHRSLSISAQSSRAVPVSKMIEMVRTDPYIPVKFGKNQPGMVSGEEHTVGIEDWNYQHGPELSPKDAWIRAANNACDAAFAFNTAGYAKEISNRILEPYMWQKAVITATQWGNAKRLRIHNDAQADIRVLFEKIDEAMQKSVPTLLRDNEWHVPYVTEGNAHKGRSYFCGDTDTNNLEDAKRYSAAKCASASYRTEILSLNKALEIYDKLVHSELTHSVPLEHVARPFTTIKYMGRENTMGFRSKGVTHADRKGNYWSGNFKGWSQLRHIFEQEKGYNTYD